MTCRGFKWWGGHVEIMGRPGLYGGMARVQHDMSRIKYQHGLGATWGVRMVGSHF